MDKKAKEARNWMGVWLLLFSFSSMEMGGVAYGMELFGIQNKYVLFLIFWAAAVVCLYMLARFFTYYVDACVKEECGGSKDGGGTKSPN